MLIVALTGGIASGKSVVADVLRSLGCFVEHADRTAHLLMAPGTPAWKKIVNHFGREILNSDRTINRVKLGTIVFAKDKERHFLNQTLHPLVIKKKKEQIRRLRKQGRYKIYVSEAALTIEAGFARFFDKIVLVFCPREVQVERLVVRDGLSRHQALQRIKSQLPSEVKRAHADYIIDSSGTIQSTIEQAERLYRSLTVDYRTKYGRP